MAVRSGAGTGVVVSLVVFVLTTVFLLVLTIVFYAGKTKEAEAKASAEAALDVYIKKPERSSDAFKAFESAAKPGSVAGYLNRRYDDVMTFAGVQSAAGLDSLKGEFARFGLKDGDTIKGRMSDMSRDISAKQTEIEGLKSELQGANAQVTEKEAQLKQEKEARQQEVNAVESRIASYYKAAEEYRTKLDTAVAELNKAKDGLRNQYTARIDELEKELDTQGRENATMRGRINEFEKARNDARIKSGNPALLVDGHIIDAPGSSEQVFIDRGSKDRIVLGMTFEIYGETAQLRVNPQTGEMPRGKASLQVTKVSDTTSTCKITRSTPGQPIIRGDLIANAVYDPSYKFKFLVHGKFDIDNDGKPTEQEAEFLRSMIIEWGGTVVTGDDLPGDLDFLVLGVEPPKPPPPPADAPAVVISDWSKKSEAHEKYRALAKQAAEAQIPVLNSNRFFVLIGHTDR